jgi:4'-phosphopantetheinyl transferase EntD
VVSSLGFDVEPATPLDDALVPLICTPSEIAWMERAGLLPDADWPKVLFCAKEAVHKCISPLTGVMLDFTEVSLSVDPSLGGFTVSIERSDPRLAPALQRVAGRLAVGEHFVFTSAVTV